FWPSIPANRMFNTGEGLGEVINNTEKFTVCIDVSQFKPEEVEVTLTGRELTVSAKHEDRSDHHGLISRSFSRKYSLPDDVDLNRVICRIVDGKLTVEAFKNDPKQAETRSIPISY
ncbi:hypothetical protein PFISCL1PPCAC_8251, partial [Pristionchus fissidentatus]